LKIVCKESGLFNEITRIKNKETQTYMFKYETITGHKGRDTFITNLIENTPINEIMKYTGHTKVSTLMKYVDKSRKVNSNYVKIFDI
jgi:integrase